MADTWPDPNDRTHLMHVNAEEDMKAIRLKAHGGPEQLKLCRAAELAAGVTAGIGQRRAGETPMPH
jgi:hypothetical protein